MHLFFLQIFLELYRKFSYSRQKETKDYFDTNKKIENKCKEIESQKNKETVKKITNGIQNEI